MTKQSIVSSLRQSLLSTNRKLRNELAAELDTLGRKEVQKRYRVVATWSEKSRPKFGYTVSVTPAQVSLEVKTKGRNRRIYNWIDQGTKGPYTIRAKTEGGRLVFQTGYSPRTAPVAQYDVGTGQAAGGWVSPMEVQHPGIEARQFEKTFRKQFKPALKRAIDNAVLRALRSKR